MGCVPERLNLFPREEGCRGRHGEAAIVTPGCCRWRGFSAKGLLEGDPNERQHPFGISDKDLVGLRRTLKDVLSRRIEPGGSPQPVFNCMRLQFAEET